MPPRVIRDFYCHFGLFREQVGSCLRSNFEGRRTDHNRARAPSRPGAPTVKLRTWTGLVDSLFFRQQQQQLNHTSIERRRRLVEGLIWRQSASILAIYRLALRIQRPCKLSISTPKAPSNRLAMTYAADMGSLAAISPTVAPRRLYFNRHTSTVSAPTTSWRSTMLVTTGSIATTTIMTRSIITYRPALCASCASSPPSSTTVRPTIPIE